jgi:hypothetical protein
MISGPPSAGSVVQGGICIGCKIGALVPPRLLNTQCGTTKSLNGSFPPFLTNSAVRTNVVEGLGPDNRRDLHQWRLRFLSSLS